MADFDSSLPVRTETPGDVAATLVDATNTAHGLAINADGSLNITDNGGSLTVDGAVTVSATDLDIRDLAFATDTVDVSGSAVTATVSATNLDIRDLVFSTDKVDVSGSSVTVSATDLDIRNLPHSQDSIKVGDGTDFLAVNTDGSINVSVAVGGTEITDYHTSASLAGAASATFDYTVTAAKTLSIQRVIASSSGKIKVEIKVETSAGSGTYSSKFVGFNSSAEANINIPIEKLLKQVAGAKVRIVITNRDKQAEDVYSTMTGIEA